MVDLGSEPELLSGLGNGIPSPVTTYLRELHTHFAALREGAVAIYIPELAKANPEWFGICLTTTDGEVYEVGDARQTFTIQSISKPFVYGLALEDRGRDGVLTKVGVEPSGDAFNSISLAPDTGCPLNPMINAGAIATTSLVVGRSSGDRLQRLLTALSTYAGRPLTIDEPVYVSERDTGHRNRAIAHLLRNFEIISSDPEPPLDLYFRQCSVSVDCRDLAVMAATLANGGVNPLTGERAVRHEFVDSILSVMTTCGMYDYAGEWVYRVGIPAKSGVAGGVLAVLPGQLGIGVFSPRLDARGNSVRGVAVYREISRDLNLHFLQVARSSRSVIRSVHSLVEISSKRLRGERERRLLDAVGERVRVFELQGDLVFAALERSVRAVVQVAGEVDAVVIDCKRVASVAECASMMLSQLVMDFHKAGKQVVVASVQHLPRFVRALEETLALKESAGMLRIFPDLDAALEWCENRLLAAEAGRPPAPSVTLAQHQACSGLSAEALEHLERAVEWRRFASGELIIRKGDPADGLYLLTSGQVSVMLALPNGQIKRLSTLSAGMAFGELAVIDSSAARNADVRADSSVECALLSVSRFDALGETHPAVKMRILENLLRQLSRTVTRLNQEVSALSS